MIPTEGLGNRDMAMAALITCEHASNRVPKAQQQLFQGARAVLRTHRAYDIGAAHIATMLARRLGAPLHLGGITRLLVDLNRSANHRDLHSEFTAGLTALDCAALVARWHEPFRRASRRSLTVLMQSTASAFQAPVLHLSVHSFTPVLAGVARGCDLGLLYDPARAAERAFAQRLARVLVAQQPTLRVRMNYPYRGAGDGHTTSLRRAFTDAQYLGLELELNQRALRRPEARRAMAALLATALRAACG